MSRLSCGGDQPRMQFTRAARVVVVILGLDLAGTINTVISDNDCMSRSTTSRKSNGNHM